MTFQFQCPNGHLLSGEPSQGGQQCTCPTCGTLFIIPAAPAAAPQAPAPSTPPAFPGQVNAGPAPAGPTAAPPNAPQPGLPQVGPQFGNAAPAAPEVPNFGGPAAAAPAAAPFQTPETVPVLHIPCPNGHELETPREMIGQDVLCPHCNVQFNLREKDSVEYKRKRREDIERKQIKSGNAWLNWAIVIAVLVVLFIGGLIVLGV